MGDNGSKISRNRPRGNDQRPWWHSGSKCVAVLSWMFTLAVAWRGTFGYDGWTQSSGLLLISSLASSILASGLAMAMGDRE